MSSAVVRLLRDAGPLEIGKVSRRVAVIGRAAVADIQVDDPTVSRLHAATWTQNGEVFIKDLGGANGTFVDGDRVTGTVSLGTGGQVLLGKHTILELSWRRESPGEPSLDTADATIPADDSPAFPIMVRVSRQGERSIVTFSHLDNGREAAFRGTRAALLLSTLAEALKLDRRRGRPGSEQGWRADDELSAQVWDGSPRSRNNLNVLLHRLRKNLLDAGIDPGCVQKEAGLCRLWVAETKGV